MQKYLNISSYKFAKLDNLEALKKKLLRAAVDRQLKGTILLTYEGINLFIAGVPHSVNDFLDIVRQIKGLEMLQRKESYSKSQPFTRMLVRIKKETIAFSQEGVDPTTKPAPYISPKELKEWYESGKEFMILDTRNDYEVRIGTFKNAAHLNIGHFKEFAEKVLSLKAEHENTPIVTFCTGGIRCEKAAPYMQQHGFKNVTQLDGGILKYFEECGGEYYNGDCFVFDKRVALNIDLQETGMKQCYRCRSPLTTEEVGSPLYKTNTSCPHCYQRHTSAPLQETNAPEC